MTVGESSISPSERVVLLTGSNLGDRETRLKFAQTEIEKTFSIHAVTSGIYTSPPWGFEANEAFYNQVLLLTNISCTPQELLKVLLNIEKKAGRKSRDQKGSYSSRTLDIDILYIGDRIIEAEGLTVPHPQLWKRRFTLLPLTEIIPDFPHPVYKKDQKELLEACPDVANVVLLRHA
ncbi:MAG: 2-amino-4-hydroxy-6-hydroxymethyldihydropteridine diphosphokinase [Cryomorphaceae bacterium]|nr:2-amino-4-hydroxy-6-hydroxymethyldihydropteridine diphosphokinase [Cryomorphaceae bacterium]